jgi:hypothetical protein
MASVIPTFKYNNINITLVPNPQYLQQTAASTEKNLTEVLSLDEHQVGRLEIYKSMENHVTDVRLTLRGMSHTLVSRIKEGKLLITISVSAFTGANANDNSHAVTNSFICHSAIPAGTTEIIGTMPAVEYQFFLRSIIRERLQIENNFTFELGGKGQKSSLGLGVAPLAFLNTDFTQLILRTYTPYESFSGITNPILDLEMTSTDPSVVVTSGPDSGYKLEVDTNIQALDFFFNEYPLYKTPYSWLIDDFSTAPSSEPSVIKVVDLLRHETWKSSIDQNLSDLVSGNIPTSTRTTANTQLALASMFKILPTSNESFHNTSSYLFAESLPLIYAKEIYTGKEIPTNAWNSAAATNNVLVSSKEGLRVKSMPNPMYKEYLTFLNETEITQSQKYNSIFFNVHPELVTYEFENVQVGDIDINKSILIPQKKLPDDSNYGWDRVGAGFRVKHIYTPVPQNPATVDPKSKESAMYSPSFKLVSEITFLLLDDRPVDLSTFDEFKPSNVPNDVQYSYDQYNDMTVFMCGQPGDINLGDYPISEPGSPGNSTVAESAKTMIDRGFRYVFGGARLDAMDCSAFTMYSVRHSGADAGRSKRYPNGTDQQLTWLLDKSNAAVVIPDKSQIQPGDIVFFKTSRGSHGHTAIAKDNTQYYHANSVSGRGDIGSFARRTPSYIFRILPLRTT